MIRRVIVCHCIVAYYRVISRVSMTMTTKMRRASPYLAPRQGHGHASAMPGLQPQTKHTQKTVGYHHNIMIVMTRADSLPTFTKSLVEIACTCQVALLPDDLRAALNWCNAVLCCAKRYMISAVLVLPR